MSGLFSDKDYFSHLAKHLENIALAALPGLDTKPAEEIISSVPLSDNSSAAKSRIIASGIDPEQGHDSTPPHRITADRSTSEVPSTTEATTSVSQPIPSAAGVAFRQRGTKRGGEIHGTVFYCVSIYFT